MGNNIISIDLHESSLSMPIQASLQPTAEQIADLRFAASKMHGAERRAFVAEMALKYCGGSARKAEEVFGWGREMVETGLGEKRTGIECLSAKPNFTGNKCWEEKHPAAATDLRRLAEEHAQQDPSFNSTIAFTRLTAAQARRQLRELGHPEKDLPAPGTVAKILKRLGYRLLRVVKAKPRKKIPQTDAIFDNVKAQDQANQEVGAKRISVDCKATVKLGDLSRGGMTRGDNRACDHDMGCAGKHTPCGILDEDTGRLYIVFGSSAKTSDFIVDSLQAWWSTLSVEEQQAIPLIQIKMDKALKAAGYEPSFSIVSSNGLTGSRSRFTSSTSLRITASTTPSSVAGESLSYTGTAPSSWMSRPCSPGLAA